MGITVGSHGTWSASEGKISGKKYRLRAGAPMRVKGTANFVLHTFGADISDVDVYLCTTSLPGSGQFRGQGGSYISANFSRLNIKGGNTFQGQIVSNLTFGQEGSVFTYA